MAAYEPKACLWCTGELTRERYVEVYSGKQPKLNDALKELVMCENCNQTLPGSFIDKVKLIVSKRPELKPYLYRLTEDQIKQK